MSTSARRYWLKLLRQMGVKHFRAKSGLGLPYICHVGDFAGEVPFYKSRHSIEEIALMASWCRDIENPVIFDVGANNGFIATQLAQLLRDRHPRIFAFEPVPPTFAQLQLSIDQLDLKKAILPIACAISDSPGICSISYDPRQSIFAQIGNGKLNPRVGSHSSLAVTITLDEVVDSLAVKPSLIKLDVEGFEPRVLRGAQKLIASDEPPAVCFEWNPLTMSEAKTSSDDLLRALAHYRFYYINDFEGQKRPFGQFLPSLVGIDWVCNVFALHAREANEAQWTATIGRIKETPSFKDWR